jgi:hypothetical protein
MAAAGDSSGFYTNLMGVVRVSPDGCGDAYTASAIIWPIHGCGFDQSVVPFVAVVVAVVLAVAVLLFLLLLGSI